MTDRQFLLVFGDTGRTGQHFTPLTLEAGHHVQVLARTPSTLISTHNHLEVVRGAVDGTLHLDVLLEGIGAVVMMLRDAAAQRERQVNTTFVRSLVPAMRRSGTQRLLHQTGDLSAAPDKRLPLAPRVMRNTVARSYIELHEDNEAVMRDLDHEARDIEWDGAPRGDRL